MTKVWCIIGSNWSQQFALLILKGRPVLYWQIQRLYGKYLRAESFRKALIYQKKYLLLLIGGFHDCEEETLATIARMGAQPSPDVVTRHHLSPLSKFRGAARVIIAISRFYHCISSSVLMNFRRPINYFIFIFFFSFILFWYAAMQVCYTLLPFCVSVCPSVCRTLRLWQNGWKYHQTFSPHLTTLSCYLFARNVTTKFLQGTLNRVIRGMKNVQFSATILLENEVGKLAPCYIACDCK